MLTIDLRNVNDSDIKYRNQAFPDGEPHITLEAFDRKEVYKVITRISNPSDLFLLLQVGDILDRAEVEWSLVVTYCMSMRMDRVVHYEEAFSLKIVANMLNSMNFTSATFVEPHSSRLLSLVRNAKAARPMMDKVSIMQNISTICYPDHGAMERNSSYVGREFCICLKKVRDLEDKNSRIKSLDIEYSPNEITNNTITIVDDLCDAGGTFCMAADLLRKKYPGVKLSILVTHLVNPVGLKNLCTTFDEVYISDSYKDWDKESTYSNLFVEKIK